MQVIWKVMIQHDALHLQQAMVPIQGYIQLRPQTGGSLPAFSVGSQSALECTGDTDSGAQHAVRRIRKASPSVSIFARDPLDAHRCFTSSHQDQWWLSCACALHFLALQLFHSDVFIILNTSFVLLPLCFQPRPVGQLGLPTLA